MSVTTFSHRNTGTKVSTCNFIDQKLKNYSFFSIFKFFSNHMKKLPKNGKICHNLDFHKINFGFIVKTPKTGPRNLNHSPTNKNSHTHV